MPFDYEAYSIGEELGIAQLPHEPTQLYAARLAVVIAQRQCVLERLLLQLNSKG